MSTLKVNTIQNTSGVEVYTAKAWVNFNGSGTVAIRASGNVSSITDVSTGRYIANFTTAMPDANYATLATFGYSGNSNPNYSPRIESQTTSAVQVDTNGSTGGYNDLPSVYVAVFR